MFQEINKNHKLLQLLITFTKKERLRFRYFLVSPYFNKRNDVQRLYNILNARTVIGKPYATKKIIPKLFPENYKERQQDIQLADYSRLKVAITELTRLAQVFILQEGRKKPTRASENDRILIDELMLRQLYKQAQAVLDKRMKSPEEKIPINRAYYLDQYRLEEAKFFLGVLGKNRSIKNEISPVVKSFHNYYLANILLYCCGMINQAQVLDIAYDKTFVEAVERMVKERLDKVPILAKIYYAMLLFLKKEGAISYFIEAKTLVDIHQDTFDSTEQRQMVNMMLNFCNDRILEGQNAYRFLEDSLYRSNFPRGIWDEGLYFSGHLFHNYIANAIVIKKLNGEEKHDDLGAFIIKYQDKLNPHSKEDILSICNARIAFAKGNVEEADTFLKAMDKKEDYFYKAYERALAIKILYVQRNEGNDRERESIRYAIQAFRSYLTPKRSPNLNRLKRKANQNFCSLILRILDLQDGIKSERKRPLLALIEDLEKMDLLVEREWFDSIL